MRRLNKKVNTKEYLATRISQLQDDRLKASDPIDKAWYARLIEELRWARHIMSRDNLL